MYGRVKNPKLYKYGRHSEYSGAAPSATQIEKECKKTEGMPDMKPIAAKQPKAQSKRRAWIEHIKKVQKEQGVASYKEAMVLARKTWTRAPRTSEAVNEASTNTKRKATRKSSRRAKRRKNE